MDSKYNRFRDSDNVQLTKDSMFEEDHNRDTGNGAISSIAYNVRPHSQRSTIRIGSCFTIRKSMLAVALVSVCALLGAIILIVSVTGHHITKVPDAPPLKTYSQTNGLLFQPFLLHKGPHIRYNSFESSTYMPYVDQLSKFLKDYSEVNQSGPQFVDCRKTGPLINKTCIFHIDDRLGRHCTEANKYGFTDDQPCILLYFKLHKNETVQPFSIDSDEMKALGDKISWDKDHVSVTCEGQDDHDEEHLGKAGKYIEYFPKEGFPTYFYPWMGQTNYLAPLVMVQFKNLMTHVKIRVACTVWNKDSNGTNPRSSPFYTAKFDLQVN